MARQLGMTVGVPVEDPTEARLKERIRDLEAEVQVISEGAQSLADALANLLTGVEQESVEPAMVTDAREALSRTGFASA